MNNKEKIKSILILLIGVILAILVYKFVINTTKMTFEDIIDSIEEVPMAQDKGLILEENLIIVGDLVK